MSLTQETLFAVLNIIMIDIILGGDNAVVIALACRKLPESKRNMAIFLGTGLAVFFRILLTAIMVKLLKIPFLLFLGGLFLIFVAYKLIADQHEDVTIKAGNTLFSAVRTIVAADLVMGLDNVLGIAGAAHGQIGLVILGLCISVPIIIWGSKLILGAMERFSGLIYIGGAVLAYTAANMLLSEPKLNPLLIDHPQVKTIIMGALIVGVLLFGWIRNQFSTSPSNKVS